MNRTEALEALRAILVAMEDTYHKFLPAQIDEMQAAIAALSLPCDICGAGLVLARGWLHEIGTVGGTITHAKFSEGHAPPSNIVGDDMMPVVMSEWDESQEEEA